LQGQLVNLAKTTPFALTEVQDASKQLLAYGFKAGDLVQTMRDLGDVSSGVGAPLTDIAYLYGTLKTSGRVMQVDLRQFAGRGIPIYESLAKVLKVNQKEINAMVHDGKIGFKDVEKAFKSMTQEGGQFFNMMNQQSQTVGGRLSNLGDSWEQLKVNIGKSQTGIISSTVTWVGQMVESLSKIFEQANRIDEAFAKAKLSFTGWEKFLNLAQQYGTAINGDGWGRATMSETQRFDQSVQENLVNPASQSLGGANKANIDVHKAIAEINKKYASGDLDKKNYERQNAILRNAQGVIEGNIRLFNSKEGPGGKKGDGTEPGGATGSASSIGSGVEVTGARPQNLTINVDKLVETLNINTTNIKEGIGEMTEGVKKALLELLNDANQAAFQ
jgi:hypothetical protein